MIAALLIGRGGSSGFPGKNVMPVLGRPLMAYPILAARNARHIDEVFLSTDSDEMKAIAADLGCHIIDRPPDLATKQALSEDAFLHGYEVVKQRIGMEPEMVVLLFCNSPTILPRLLDEGVEFLRANEDYDSATTTSVYNMFSPLRARRLDADGSLKPFVALDAFENANCDRDSQGDVYFADCSGFVVRPRCFNYDENGEPPFRWMGKRVHAVKQWGGIDVDYPWQVGQVVYWLRQHGFDEMKTPYDG